jgi:hypothetical protein
MLRKMFQWIKRTLYQINKIKMTNLKENFRIKIHLD